ncbi:hypothetical protein ACNKHK_23565 [Shigella flexneri]
MLDPLTIVDMAAADFSPVDDLQHLNIMITAGPTREPLDPCVIFPTIAPGRWDLLSRPLQQGAGQTSHWYRVQFHYPHHHLFSGLM